VTRALVRERSFVRRRRVQSLSRSVFDRTGENPSWHRVNFCGHPLGEFVPIRVVDGRAYFAHVAACGLVWVCPTCSTMIRTRRAEELERGTSEWVSRGGSLVMMTLTVRHNASLPLDRVRASLQSAWRVEQSRKSYMSLRELTAGVVRSTEVTIGDNGWHPHLHLLLFVRPGVSSDEVMSLLPALITDWRSLVGAALDDVLPPSVERAIDLTFFDDAAAAAHYVSKIAKEITQSNSKSGRDPFSLLDVEGLARPRAVARFLEYLDSMRGVQSLSWSKGLRALLGLSVPLSDEELAQESLEMGVEVLALPASEYLQLLRGGLAASFLVAVEIQVDDEKLEVA